MCKKEHFIDTHTHTHPNLCAKYRNLSALKFLPIECVERITKSFGAQCAIEICIYSNKYIYIYIKQYTTHIHTAHRVYEQEYSLRKTL